MDKKLWFFKISFYIISITRRENLNITFSKNVKTRHDVIQHFRKNNYNAWQSRYYLASNNCTTSTRVINTEHQNKYQFRKKSLNWSYHECQPLGFHHHQSIVVHFRKSTSAVHSILNLSHPWCRGHQSLLIFKINKFLQSTKLSESVNVNVYSTTAYSAYPIWISRNKN